MADPRNPRTPRSMNTGRLTLIIGIALAVVIAAVVVLAVLLRGGAGVAPEPSDGPNVSASVRPSVDPSATAKPAPTLAPTTGPSLRPVSERYNGGQLADASTAAATGYLQYCAYQAGENAKSHVTRMSPYYATGSALLAEDALATNIATATCSTIQNQVVGLDANSRPVVKLIIKTDAKLKAGGTSKRTVTAYLTMTQQRQSWRILDVQQSSVASR